MKKVFCALLAFTLLEACGLLEGPAGVGVPRSVDVKGARGFFLQSPFVSTPAPTGRAAVVPSGGQLIKIPRDAETHPATFYASNGTAVDAAIYEGLALNSRSVLLAYRVDDHDHLSVLDTGSGILYDFPAAPDNWDLIRVKNGRAYLVSSGRLCSVDLSSFTSITLGTGVSSSSRLVVNQQGDVFSFDPQRAPNERCTIYYSDGSAPEALSSLDSESLWQGLSAADGSVFAVQDAASADLFLLRFGDGLIYPTGTLVAQRYFLASSGPDRGVKAETPSVLTSGTFQGSGVLVTSGESLFQDSVLTSGGSYVQVTETAGRLFATVLALPPGVHDWADAGRSQLSGGRILFPGLPGDPRMGSLDLLTGAVATIFNQPGLAAFESVGEMAYFTNDTSVYQYQVPDARLSLYLGEPKLVQRVWP